MTDSTVHVGVMRLVLRVPGARSLKDRRRVIVSLRDRVRHRFELTFAEVHDSERPERAVVVLTTAGNDGRLIRSILDKTAQFVGSSGKVLLEQVDVDVFPWHPSHDLWSPDAHFS